MAFCRFSSSLFLFFLLCVAFPFHSHAEIPREVAEKIERVNRRGEHYGLVVSSRQELRVVLDERSGTFRPDRELPTIDISGRRFHVGQIGGRRSLVVMCGRGMMNAAQTTQLLVTLFRVRAVVEYGRGASANPNKLNIGDVAIPRQFAHTGLIYWEKFGGDDERYDRDIANLTFSDYNVGKSKEQVANELQSIYPQREEVFSMRGKAEEGRDGAEGVGKVSGRAEREATPRALGGQPHDARLGQDRFGKSDDSGGDVCPALQEFRYEQERRVGRGRAQ